MTNAQNPLDLSSFPQNNPRPVLESDYSGHPTYLNPFFKDGEVLEWVGTCIDITERKHLEEELKKANEVLEERVRERTKEVSSERQRLYGVLETLPVFVVLLDEDHKVPFANKFFRERFGDSKGRSRLSPTREFFICAWPDIAKWRGRLIAPVKSMRRRCG